MDVGFPSLKNMYKTKNLQLVKKITCPCTEHAVRTSTLSSLYASPVTSPLSFEGVAEHWSLCEPVT